jgi:ferrous iron transport protein B
MLMGFGCNVPAIMATRAIESRSSRLITILITPFMSCSARLPVLILFAGTFFPQHAALVLISLYLLGIAVAIITARLLRLTKFKKDETPFVMELPPYRMPTLQSTIRHMWDKCALYLKKIGSVILLSTIVIWFLSYYPRPTENTETTTGNVVLSENVKTEEIQNIASDTPESINSKSFIGMIGHAIEPAMKPLGLNWRSSIAILTSIPAKELVVSTLGVLYSNSSDEGIEQDIKASGDFTPRSAMSFMVFILLFFPCIATVASIAEETKSKGWAIFSIVYNTAIAWVIAFLTYTIGGIL